MKIKLIDENLVGQKGLSRYLDPGTNWMSDDNEYDIGIYTDKMCYTQPINPDKINCAWIIEPPIINGENYIEVVKIKDKFKYIFSYIKDLHNKVDNYIFVPAGGTWLRDEDIGIHQKTKLVSFIFSWKKWNPYHMLRYRIYDRFRYGKRVDFFGTGSDNPIEFKIDGLKDYKFSIVVENCIEEDYFTEKLIDCFLTGTIPIYLGTRKVSEYFDENGIIFFNGDEDLPQIMDTLNDSLYSSKIESVERNFELAKSYIHPEKLIQKFLDEVKF